MGSGSGFQSRSNYTSCMGITAPLLRCTGSVLDRCLVEARKENNIMLVQVA